MIWTIALAAIAAILTYIFVVRPFLAALPMLKEFYADADTFWQKVLALGWNSLTVAWSYALMVFGFFLQQLDTIVAMFASPDFQAQLNAALGGNPKILGYVLMAIAWITFISRMRSIVKG